MTYRVYNTEKTPLEGGKLNVDYFNARSKKMAIRLTELLNSTTKRNWVWA